MYYGWEPRITQGEMVEFLNICLAKAGADSMITPREMLRDYMTVLNILMQNDEADFGNIIGKVTLKSAEEKEENVSHDTEDSNNSQPTTAKKLTDDQLDILEF